MAAIAQGSSATITVADKGYVTIASNGGLFRVAETPIVGPVRDVLYGPVTTRRIFGPYAVGATVAVTNQTVDTLVYTDAEIGTAVTTPVAVGAPQVITLGDQGFVSIASNGGFFTVAATPAIGIATSRVYGPEPVRTLLGPYPVSASLTVTNTSCSSLSTIMFAASSTPDPNNVRFSTLTNVVESGTSPYIYTATVGGFSARAGVSTKSISASTDGAFTVTLPTNYVNTQEPVMGLAISNAAASYTTWLFGAYPNNASLFNYKAVDSGVGGLSMNNLLFTPAGGDQLRIRRIGTQCIAEVNPGGSAPGSGIWHVMHVYATAAGTAQLFPQVNFSGIGDNFTIGTLVSGPYPKWTSGSINMVFDGNSITRGRGTSSIGYNISASVSKRPPYIGTGQTSLTNGTTNNFGLDGQTWRMMDGLDAGSSADVDAAWAAGKTNVLVASEGTNTLFLGITSSANISAIVTQAIGDATNYIANRQIAHNWNVRIICTQIPRNQPPNGGGTVADMNSGIDQYNSYIRSNYLAMGYTHLCDFRVSGSPYNFNSYSSSDFNAVASYYNGALDTPYQVHPTDIGYSCMSSILSDVLSTIGI